MTSRANPVRLKIPQEHLIGRIDGLHEGPALICIAGLHGNEPLGLNALLQVFSDLRHLQQRMSGSFVALAGNLAALRAGQRFLDEDLNRIWKEEDLERLKTSAPSSGSERREQEQLFGLLDRLLSEPNGEKYFLDLHTSSAAGSPFAIFSDSLRNRDFARWFPSTKILGLEELLDGPLLDYVGSRGAVTLGFEAGQHEDPQSVEIHAAAIWVGLVTAGLLSAGDCPQYKNGLRRLLRAARPGPRIVDVHYRHPVRVSDQFRMMAGFSNFQPVKRDQVLAGDFRGPVKAPREGLILMPLYQEQGQDGFFLVRTVSPFWLGVSRLLRHLPLDYLLRLLPGIHTVAKRPHALDVKPQTLRWLTLDLFHLLGYRKRRRNGRFIRFTKRGFDLKSPFQPSKPKRER